MNITTPPIDPAHPLAKLIERSLKAHKLPSCEGCKHMAMKQGDSSGECDLAGLDAGKARHPDSAMTCYNPDEWHASLIVYRLPTHFCAAWEPKS